jgi:hypothetical protein
MDLSGSRRGPRSRPVAGGFAPAPLWASSGRTRSCSAFPTGFFLDRFVPLMFVYVQQVT